MSYTKQHAAENAELANGFPDISYQRIRHQVLKVMAEYRGRKKAEWKE